MSLRGIRWAALAVTAALAACSSDKTTGPSTPLPPVEGGPYDGDWVLSWGDIAGSGAICRVPSVVLFIQQFGDTVHGSYSGHREGACVLEGILYTTTSLLVGKITGRIQGDSIELSFGLPSFTVWAKAQDSVLTGTMLWSVGFPGSQTGTANLTSTWSARRIPSAPPPTAPFDIQLYPDLPLVIEGGPGGQLQDTVRNDQGQILSNIAPTFSTPDTATADVGASGLVHGRGGRLRPFSIAARAGSAYTDEVGINIPGAASIRILPESISMNRGHSIQLRVTILDSVGDSIGYVPPSYAVTSAGTVTVSSTGLVRAGSALGRATVIVGAGGVIDSVPVSVVAVPVSVQMTPTLVVIPPLDSVQLSFVALDSGGLPVPDPSVTYSSGNPAIVRVVPSGMAVAGDAATVGPIGYADITATLGSLTTKSRVVVRAGPPPRVAGTTDVAGEPYVVAAGRTGAVYVGDLDGGGLWRGDLPAFGLPRAVKMGSSVTSVAFDSVGRRAFAASDSLGQVVVIDVDSNRVIGHLDLPAGFGAATVGVTPDGNKVVVAAGTGTANTMLIYDSQTLALLDSIPGEGAEYLSFHPFLPRVYTSARGDIREIDLNSKSVLRTFSVAAAHMTAVAADGSELYAADEHFGLRVWNLGTGALVSSVPLGDGGVVGLGLSTARDLLYVSIGMDGTVAVLDRPSRIEIARFAIGGIPWRLAVDPTGSTVVVTNIFGWVSFVQ